MINTSRSSEGKFWHFGYKSTLQVKSEMKSFAFQHFNILCTFSLDDNSYNRDGLSMIMNCHRVGNVKQTNCILVSKLNFVSIL